MMTRNVEFKEQDYKDVSPDDLHAAIKTQLGDKFFGVSTSPDGVILHFDDTVTGSDITKARLAYDEHDIAMLPAKPRPKSIEERFAELEAEIVRLKAEKVDKP
jgi:uncharacterized small protein (DUF1192 family)